VTLLTPGLRLDQFQLDAGSCLVVFPYFPAHAEAQSNHVVLFTVPRATAFDVVSQGCLQGTTLSRKKEVPKSQPGTAGQDWLSPLVLQVP
jgi:hypothetical protein